MKDKGLKIMASIMEKLESLAIQEKYKLSPQDFTRQKKIGFVRCSLFVMNLLRLSFAKEVVDFIDRLKQCKQTGIQKFTSSAMIQSRNKIKAELFKELAQTVQEDFYSKYSEEVKYWKGYRVLAIDSSVTSLPNTPELKSLYGTSKNQTETPVVTARCSVLYDVLNRYILDAILSPMSKGEATISKAHLDYTQRNDLIIYDRGYASFDLCYELFALKRDFIIRVKLSHSTIVKNFAQSNRSSEVVAIQAGQNRSLKDKAYDRNTTVKVRLIAVRLANGTKEILMTSLLDEKMFPTTDFKDLYFRRWKLETCFDELKNKLKIEYFSGYAKNTILQDFYAAIFICNLQTLIVSDIAEEIIEKTKHCKYGYKVNDNLSYGFIKNEIIALLVNKDPNSYQKLKDLLLDHLVPIRPNRTNPRDTGKYRKRYKPKVTKNQRFAI